MSIILSLPFHCDKCVCHFRTPTNSQFIPRICNAQSQRHLRTYKMSHNTEFQSTSISWLPIPGNGRERETAQDMERKTMNDKTYMRNQTTNVVKLERGLLKN